MGYWRSLRGTIGDGPADLLGVALTKIAQIYLHDTGRRITQGELADLVEFVTCGQVVSKAGQDSSPMVEPRDVNKDTPLARKRGVFGRRKR